MKKDIYLYYIYICDEETCTMMTKRSHISRFQRTKILVYVAWIMTKEHTYSERLKKQMRITNIHVYVIESELVRWFLRYF